MRSSRTQIVIAGAGPVGSVAAYFLATHGIDVVLAETASECATDLRASTFHPPTLEMLDELGLTDKLIGKGLKAPIFHFRERQTNEIIDFDMAEISDVTKYPYRLQCEQHHLSRMLTNALKEHPRAEVKFSHRLVGFNQDKEGVDVFLEAPTEILEVRADYLIGSDGANSIVRKWLDTEFIGFTYPEKFVCFTTKAPLENTLSNLAYVNYISDPQEWVVLLRVPGLWRILVPASEENDDAALLSDAKKNQVFDGLLKSGPEIQTEHRTIYRVHQRVAKRFVHDRVITIGDAAHLNNPLGGFGMNSGIHDAVNLCKKLLQIYNHKGDADKLLSKFERQRQKTTHDFIQMQSKKNMDFMKEGKSSEHMQRKIALNKIKGDPEARRQYLLNQSMIQCLRDEGEIQ